MIPTIQELIARYGEDGEHPEVTRVEWDRERKHYGLEMGYWEWVWYSLTVRAQIEADEASKH